jgi:hypothetical protein
MRWGIALLVMLAAPAFGQSSTDLRDRERMIAASIRAYPGNCPCPYNTDRAGRRCGARSAYDKPGGHAPLCFPSDISDSRLAAWRAAQ